jgi:excisionase family DNA binding protein
MEFTQLADKILEAQNDVLQWAEESQDDAIVGAKAAAKYLGISIHTTVQAVQCNRILAVRVGTKLYFSRQWLDDFNKSQYRFKTNK